MFYIVLGFGIFMVAMGSIFFVADVPGAVDRFARNVQEVEQSMIGSVRENNNPNPDAYYYDVAEPPFPRVVPVSNTAMNSSSVSIPALPQLQVTTEMRRDINREQQQVVDQVSKDIRAAFDQ